MGELIIDEDFDPGPTYLLLVQLVLQVEHVGLDEEGFVNLGHEVGTEVVLGEVLVRFHSEVQDVTPLEIEVDDGCVEEGLLIDLLVEVDIQISLEVS